MIIQHCAKLCYPKISKVFTKYALLGDDVVIHDQKVAESYLQVMTQIGVKINLEKTVKSDNLIEFAKR